MVKVIKAHRLRRGDRFSFIPAEWYGPGVVRDSYGMRRVNCSPLAELIGEKVSGTWTLKFDNAKVINPPGVWYGHPDTKVRLLKRVKRARHV
jgi:hypothetical protein